MPIRVYWDHFDERRVQSSTVCERPRVLQSQLRLAGSRDAGQYSKVPRWMEAQTGVELNDQVRVEGVLALCRAPEPIFHLCKGWQAQCFRGLLWKVFDRTRARDR